MLVPWAPLVPAGPHQSRHRGPMETVLVGTAFAVLFVCGFPKYLLLPLLFQKPRIHQQLTAQEPDVSSIGGTSQTYSRLPFDQSTRSMQPRGYMDAQTHAGSLPPTPSSSHYGSHRDGHGFGAQTPTSYAYRMGGDSSSGRHNEQNYVGGSRGRERYRRDRGGFQGRGGSWGRQRDDWHGGGGWRQPYGRGYGDRADQLTSTDSPAPSGRGQHDHFRSNGHAPRRDSWQRQSFASQPQNGDESSGDDEPLRFGQPAKKSGGGASQSRPAVFATSAPRPAPVENDLSRDDEPLRFGQPAKKSGGEPSQSRPPVFSTSAPRPAQVENDSSSDDEPLRFGQPAKKSGGGASQSRPAVFATSAPRPAPFETDLSRDDEPLRFGQPTKKPGGEPSQSRPPVFSTSAPRPAQVENDLSSDDEPLRFGQAPKPVRRPSNARQPVALSTAPPPPGNDDGRSSDLEPLRFGRTDTKAQSRFQSNGLNAAPLSVGRNSAPDRHQGSFTAGRQTSAMSDSSDSPLHF